MAFNSHLRICIGIALTLFATYRNALANVGPPSSGGYLIGEPLGINDVEITRETLTIDLRPLAANGLAQVEAVYHLLNQGEEKNLDLVFAGGAAGMAEFQVWLDDVAIPSKPANDIDIPANWQSPKYTPSLQDGQRLDYLLYSRSRLVPRAFTVTIPSGARRLRVRYAAEAATHFYGRPTVYRQFAYVLAPARSWSGFGGIDVKVHLPKDWRAACTPALTRQHDTLAGTFDHLPADAIALTVQAPQGWAYDPLVYASLVLFGFVILTGPIFCWRFGRPWRRHLLTSETADSNEPARHAWARSLGIGALWGFAVLGTGLIAVFGPELVLPSGQVTRYGYGQALAMMGVFALSAVAAPTGFAIAQITSILPCRNASTKASRSCG